MPETNERNSLKLLCVEDQFSDIEGIYLPLLKEFAAQTGRTLTVVWCDAAPVVQADMERLAIQSSSEKSAEFTITPDGNDSRAPAERHYSLWDFAAVVVDNYLPGQDEGVAFCRLVVETFPRFRSMILFTRRGRGFPAQSGFWTLPKPIDPDRYEVDKRKFIFSLHRCCHCYEVTQMPVDVLVVWAENRDDARDLLPQEIFESAHFLDNAIGSEDADALRYARGYIEMRRTLDRARMDALLEMADQIVMPVVIYVTRLPNELVDEPERLVDHSNLRLLLSREEVSEISSRLHSSPTIVGNDTDVREAFGELSRCARKATFISERTPPGEGRYGVMIFAPKGSGKELAFNYYHSFSDKLFDSRDNVQDPVVVFPSGSGKEAVRDFRIELFGFGQRGGNNEVQGLLEQHADNTLVIDEFQDCGPIVQGSMRRAVERGGPVGRVSGGAFEYYVRNIRFVFVTMADPRDPASEFDDAMVTRCRVIAIPSLDDRRRGEKSLLAEYMLLKKDPSVRFSDSALDLIEERRWPGNVRELKLFVDNVVALHNRAGLSHMISVDEVATAFAQESDWIHASAFSREKTEELAVKLCEGTISQELRQMGRTCSWKSHTLIGLTREELFDAILFVFFSKRVGSWKELAQFIHHPYNVVKDGLPGILGPISTLKGLRAANSGSFESFREAWLETRPR